MRIYWLTHTWKFQRWEGLQTWLDLCAPWWFPEIHLPISRPGFLVTWPRSLAGVLLEKAVVLSCSRCMFSSLLRTPSNVNGGFWAAWLGSQALPWTACCAQGGGVLWARSPTGNQKEIQGDKVDCYRRPLHSKVVWSSAQPASWGLALMLFV